MGIFKLAGGASIFSGLSHTTLQAYSHFGMYFYFGSFIAIGLLQIFLGYLKWRGAISDRVFWLSTLVNGGATVFWLLTRLMYAPFMGGTEAFTALGVGVVALQLLTVAVLCFQRKNLAHAAVVVCLSIVLGFGAHASAMGLEKLVPALGGTGTHNHGHGHGDESADDMGMSAEQHAVMLAEDAATEGVDHHDGGADGEDHHAESDTTEHDDAAPDAMEQPGDDSANALPAQENGIHQDLIVEDLDDATLSAQITPDTHDDVDDGHGH